MRHRFPVLLPLIVFLALCVSACAPSDTAPAQDVETTALVDSARALVQAAMVDDQLPGLSIAVAVDGEIVWSEGFGYADVEAAAPVTERSKFRVGSVSKPYTATAIAQLMQDGRLDVDAPIQQYVPSFPKLT